MTKSSYIILTRALLLLSTLTGCPVQDSDDDTEESGSDSTGSSSTDTSSDATMSSTGT